ncbi:hypothetical protein BASA61_001858 [Batrachochytrium salamandrivorans]|nr:hypothetical protein BASA62_009812 [Batrachochytrium salamandrivorans]KAH6601654.1 hypothetical protein BASA61_001858 [Batrachochytrium salamandrivorans]KAH9273121.1 hypothetical protein BASA83_004699 [Batrachochytrium salamandrivorans]
MFDPLLWVLHHFVTHYAGQNTQGNTNDGDNANQASGSKDAASLPQGVYSLSLPTTLQESDTLDQSGASSSADSQPGKECTGGHGIRKLSKSCPQQQSQLEPQPSTSYGPPQSDEMPLPAYFKIGVFQYYTRFWKTKQHRKFIKEEARYFKSEYLFEKKLGEGKSGAVFLATRKSDGKKVAYKSISNSDVYEYASKSTPPPRCHLPNPLVCSEEPSAIPCIAYSEEQSVIPCMSPRPPNLYVPYEFVLQMYLSRPGHENPYVPVIFDYITLKNEFVLVMEYFGEDWVTLAKYVKERKRLDIEHARDIVREVVDAMVYLKQYGVVHRDLHSKVKVIDFGITGILPGWKEGKSVPLKFPDPLSTVSGYKARSNELRGIWCLGKLLYRILTGIYPYAKKIDYEYQQFRNHDSDCWVAALDPGVENVYTWLRGGVLNGEADLDQRWLDGTVEHESMGTRHDNRALAARLADFLQVAYRQYQSTLWKYHRDRLVEVG